jgi:predicted ATP-grasp superfamily ATP-dependent carboligase
MYMTLDLCRQSNVILSPAPRATKPVGAVVIGGDYQGLGIVRSLGRRGIPTCVIDDERSIARFSRYTNSADRVHDLRDPQATVDALLRVGRERDLKGWVLYPTRDETVAAISQHRSELTEFFRVPTPPWEVVQWLWDKRRTYRLAQQLGIAIPRTWLFRTEEDLKEIDSHLPVAIKPAIKEHFIYSTGDKAWRADTPDSHHTLFRRALGCMPRDEVMVQDLIPGHGTHQFAYCAFFKNGSAVASVVVRRCRQHPLEFGRASTYVETTELPELEELSERFLRAIDYYGLVELEYKLDPRDGAYRLLDVNGRTWGYHSIGRQAGVDFPALLFADQMNQEIDPCRGRPGVKWIRLITDLPTGALSILKGQISGRSYLRSLRDYDEEAVFSKEDPLPGIVELALLPYLSIVRGF